MKFLLSLFVSVLLFGCSSSNDANKALKAMGFTNIQTTGYSIFGCSDDDTFHTGFTAIDLKGNTVSGVVCSGWVKGATVRIN